MIAYERLTAWRLAHRLALEVYSASDRWPRAELYGVTAQTRWAALSVPTNIAEGAAKRGRLEFGRYLNIALGSLAELAYLLRFARDRHLLQNAEWAPWTPCEMRSGGSSTACTERSARRPPVQPALHRPSDRPTVRPSD